MITALTALPLLVPVTLSLNGETDAEWLELDREIASLAAPVYSPETGGFQIAADAILSYQLSDDDFYTGGGESESGVTLRRVRLTGKGSVGDLSYKISGDLAGGQLTLKDAYASWQCSEMLGVTFGQYKNPLLWSGRVSSFADPFHDIAVTAKENSGRSPGFMLEGDFGVLAWLLSVQNGVDGMTKENLIVGRVEWDILGEGAFGKWHGAYGYGDETQLSIAGGFMDDGAIDNGSAVSGEFGLVMGAFSVRGDMVSYDEEYDMSTGLDLDSTLGTAKTDTTPSSLTLGYLFGGAEWELLARMEAYDDTFDTDRTSFGIVRYTSFGPKLRWALLYQEFSSDLEALEGTRVELSLALAGS